MTDKKETPDNNPEQFGLAEFETESAISLAEFEAESAILLDEYVLDKSSMLDEFEAGMETIFVDLLGSTSDESPELDEDEKDNEKEPIPDEVEDESVQSEDEEQVEDSDEAVDQAEIVGEEIPPEPEPVELPPEPVREPVNPVIGFVCEHALDISKLTGPGGRMNGRRMVFLQQFPCSGMVKPAWLGYALDKGASGAFIITCNPGSCHHRTGASITEKRLNNHQEPMLSNDVDRRRIELFFGHPAGTEELLKKLDEFLAVLGKIDHVESTTEDEAEQDEKKEMGEWLM